MQGAHWSGIDPPDWLCLLVRRGHAGFFPEMVKRMAHYTEPTDQKSNLIKLLVPHPLENLYTLSFGSSP